MKLDDTLAELLCAQLELQRRSLNINPLTMSTVERIAYVEKMVLGATHELHEGLDEVTWKSWATGEPRVHDEHLFNELIDVLHFVFNLFLVSRQLDPLVLASEIRTAYLRKHEVNVQRQRTGYDGRSTKCHNCARALDDVGVRVTSDEPVERSVSCAACGDVVNPRILDGLPLDLITVVKPTQVFRCPACLAVLTPLNVRCNRHHDGTVALAWCTDCQGIVPPNVATALLDPVGEAAEDGSDGVVSVRGK